MKKIFFTLALLAGFASASSAQSNIDINAGIGNGLRFWSGNNTYKIHMGTGFNYHYGDVTDYAIKNNMSNHANRGWVWGVYANVPVAAISTQGNMKIKGNFISETGSASIGTSTLYGKLSIQGSQLTSVFASTGNENTYIRPGNGAGNVIMDYGNVGVGTAWPADKLDVNGNMVLGSNVATWGNGNGGKLTFRRTYDGSATGSITLKSFGLQNADEMSFYMPGGGSIYTFSNFYGGSVNEHMRIAYDGNVGIGTTKTTGFKLSVEGKMRAREIEVNAYAWADYVFEDTYQLMSLYEVQEFIATNNHLPNVPSEATVLEEGINLAEMDAVLLRKLEELTLYVIELKEENDELRGLIESK